MALIASLMKQASKAWVLKLDRGGWRSEMRDCGEQHLWTPSGALTWGKEKHGTVLGWIKTWNADLCCVGETRGWEGRTSREGWSRAHGVKAGETNSGLGEAWVKPPSVDKKDTDALKMVGTKGKQRWKVPLAWGNSWANVSQKWQNHGLKVTPLGGLAALKR